VVCDYKTNRIAPSRSEPTAAHFHPARLPTVMAGNHYQLQALLYCVALHRYLRWRLPDYDPTVHLGGVGYLFVRGMIGPSTPTHDGIPNGVADWRPGASLIVELSDVLDGSTMDSS
jgi:exodeoxyribonuclease V beta subunit